MSNRPARITQAEIERLIRAAKKAGACELKIKIGDEAVAIIPISADKPVAESPEIIL